MRRLNPVVPPFFLSTQYVHAIDKFYNLSKNMNILIENSTSNREIETLEVASISDIFSNKDVSS